MGSEMCIRDRSNSVVNGILQAMFPGCVNSDYASKCANQLAAGARVHAAQIPQGTGIRHTPHMSAFKIDD